MASTKEIAASIVVFVVGVTLPLYMIFGVAGAAAMDVSIEGGATSLSIKGIRLGESKSIKITIKETGGRVGLQGVHLAVDGNLSFHGPWDPIDMRNIVFDKNDFDVPAGGSVVVTVTFRMPAFGNFGENADSSMTITTKNDGSKKITIEVNVAK